MSPVLGASVHVLRGDSSITTFALGVDPSAQGDYQLAAGRDASAPNSFVANDDFLRATHAKIGDTLRVAAGFDPQLRTHSGERALVLAGRARFLYLAANQLAIAIPLRTLQQMTGAAREDRVSLFMVRLRDPGRVDVRQAMDALRASCHRRHLDGGCDGTRGRAAQLLSAAQRHPGGGQPDRGFPPGDDAGHRFA